jgi:hypothetical protein
LEAQKKRLSILSLFINSPEKEEVSGSGLSLAAGGLDPKQGTRHDFFNPIK